MSALRVTLTDFFALFDALLDEQRKHRAPVQMPVHPENRFDDYYAEYERECARADEKHQFDKEQER